jgi:hypothetical protein
MGARASLGCHSNHFFNKMRSVVFQTNQILGIVLGMQISPYLKGRSHHCLYLGDRLMQSNITSLNNENTG